MVTGKSESITPSEVIRGNATVEFIARHISLTGKQIDFILRFLPLFSLGIELVFQR